MKMRAFAPLLFGAAMIAGLFAAPATRADQPLIVQPGVYDPGHTGIVDAAWVTKQGLPDPNGNADHALYLQKFGLTTDNAAAGADVKGVNGIVVTPGFHLGFDVRLDGHAGAGAPRFDVVATDGFHFVGGPANGTVTGTTTDSRGRAWERVRFDTQNPAQSFPVFAPGARLISVSIVFDEGTDAGPDFTGYVYLDNIDINGTLIGKPGAAK